MALIQDPDNLNQGTEVVIDSAAKTIKLAEAGNLDADGVTLQTVYSFLKEEWGQDSALIRHTFPMISITETQFEFVNGWKPADDATRKLIRNAGWAEVDAAGLTEREYAGIISLGQIGATDQPYFQQADAEATVDFTYQGAVNEAVQIFGDADNGNFDKRGYFKLFVREQGKQYAQAELSDIGETALTYKLYSFPLANGADLKITSSDATIAADAPYTSIDITYYGTPQARDIGGTNRNFDVIIDAAGATAEQVYEKVQYLLRQTSDIDAGAGTVAGNSADDLLKFVGDTLVTSQGVYIDNFDSNDTNRLEFFDNTGVKRTFPYVAAGTISFNANLKEDAAARYWLFFKDANGNLINTSNAIIAEDASGTPIEGLVSGRDSVSWSFDYDGNAQGGRSAGTDAVVVARAIGLDTGQFVEAEATITKAIGQNIALVAALERNYRNA